MKKISILLIALLTSSCNVSLVYEPTTIKELLPVGSTLRLTKTLDIPANRSYMYIANGKVAPLTSVNPVDIYEPYCMFGFNKESPRVRHVMPDQFEVTKVVEWERYYSGVDYKKIASANNRGGGLIKVVNATYAYASGPSTIMYATIITLHSDKQPDVKKIVCGHWDEQGAVEPLTLYELKIALGGLIIIKGDGVH